MPLEVEIKLSIKPDQIARFKTLESLSRAYHHEILELHSDYYDTNDHFLRRHGFVLRIRQENGRFMQTIKTTEASHNGMHERHEWEIELNENQPNFSQLPHDYLKTLIFDHGLEKQIQPLFATVFTRENWCIEFQSNTTIQVSLDQGYVKAAQTRFPICEVELELIQGEKTELQQFAEQLRHNLNLRPTDSTKAGRGYRITKEQALAEGFLI
ncbi:MAG: CYTH domain-containing protein [Legionellales bacterium]|nr:CYTH domain-containing protein [Legionellales bacterium]